MTDRTRMKFLLGTLAAGAACHFALWVAIGSPVEPTAGQPTGETMTVFINGSPRTLDPCPTEDSETSCFWDAEKRGNGRGTSFVVINTEEFTP